MPASSSSHPDQVSGGERWSAWVEVENAPVRSNWSPSISTEDAADTKWTWDVTHPVRWTPRPGRKESRNGPTSVVHRLLQESESPGDLAKRSKVRVSAHSVCGGELASLGTWGSAAAHRPSCPGWQCHTSEPPRWLRKHHPVHQGFHRWNVTHQKTIIMLFSRSENCFLEKTVTCPKITWSNWQISEPEFFSPCPVLFLNATAAFPALVIVRTPATGGKGAEGLQCPLLPALLFT